MVMDTAICSSKSNPFSSPSALRWVRCWGQSETFLSPGLEPSTAGFFARTKGVILGLFTSWTQGTCRLSSLSTRKYRPHTHTYIRHSAKRRTDCVCAHSTGPRKEPKTQSLSHNSSLRLRRHRIVPIRPPAAPSSLLFRPTIFSPARPRTSMPPLRPYTQLTGSTA